MLKHNYNKFFQISTLRKDVDDKERTIEQLKVCSQTVDGENGVQSIVQDEIENLTHKLNNANQLISTLQVKVSNIERENHRLRGELSCFDLDFFEELEDLKYNYAEAKRKLGEV
jgi:predicted RNase H-like nuclease (RuvC/YqgF family)